MPIMLAGIIATCLAPATKRLITIQNKRSTSQHTFTQVNDPLIDRFVGGTVCQNGLKAFLLSSMALSHGW